MVVKMISGICSCFIGGAVITGAVSGTGFLVCYCGLKAFQWATEGDRNNVNNAALNQWPDHVRHRVGTTFKYLGGGLGLTVGAAVLASQSELIIYLRNCNNSNSVWVDIGVCCAIYGTWLVCKYTVYEPHFLSKKHVVWAFRSGVMGSALALLTSGGISTLVAAGLSTAVIVAGYATIATVHAYCCSPEKIFLPWVIYLRIGLIIISGSTLAFHFASPDILMKAIFGSIVINGSLALPPACILYDTQQMISTVETTPTDAPFDPINAQMDLFSDSFWIFVLCIVFVDSIKK